jgi:hypothetical protein
LLLEPIMKHSFAAGAVFLAALGLAGAAVGQPVRPLSASPFFMRPAMPESMPTVEPFSAMAPDNVSGTAMHGITATPQCGASTPQNGKPSMVTGTCP